MSREREKKVYVVTDHQPGESRRTWRDVARGLWAVFCLICGAVAALIGAVLGTRAGIGRQAAAAIRDAYRGDTGRDKTSEDEDHA